MNNDTIHMIPAEVYYDSRGWFKEGWRENKSNDHYVQENVSKSKKGVLRGLHFQYPKPQAKLVRVFNGKIRDVVIDIRKDSPTYLKVDVFNLSEVDGFLYVPKGYAHGFVSLTDDTIVSYKCSEYYDPTGEYTLRWDDPAVKDAWGMNEKDLIISDKDMLGLTLDYVKNFV